MKKRQPFTLYWWFLSWYEYLAGLVSYTSLLTIVPVVLSSLVSQVLSQEKKQQTLRVFKCTHSIVNPSTLLTPPRWAPWSPSSVNDVSTILASWDGKWTRDPHQDTKDRKCHQLSPIRRLKRLIRRSPGPYAGAQSLIGYCQTPSHELSLYISLLFWLAPRNQEQHTVLQALL